MNTTNQNVNNNPASTKVTTITTKTNINNVERVVESLPDGTRRVTTNVNETYTNKDFTGTEVLKTTPEPFKAFGKICRMTDKELCERVLAHFKPTFHELVGANLKMSMSATGPVFMFEFFFEKNNQPMEPGSILSIESLTRPVALDTNNMFANRMVVNNRLNGNNFTLNNETRLLMSRFMFKGKQYNAPSAKVWNDKLVMDEIHIGTAPVPYMQAYNTERILMRLGNISPYAILKELFGTRIVYESVSLADGEENHISNNASYQIRFIKNLPDGRVALNIEQFDEKQVQEIVISENPAYRFNSAVQMWTM